MIELFILLAMLFFHIVDDYYLQGVLAKLKQKKWWKENYPGDMYKNDYIIALIEHAFSWSFMIMLPMLYYCYDKYMGMYVIFFILNWIIHAVIDDLKANKMKINLIQDQIAHVIMICITWLVIISKSLEW